MSEQKYTKEEVLAKINAYRKECLSSFLRFTKAMYKLRTGRDFEISQPQGRESHYITIAKELSSVVRGENQNLIINVPPRYGKSELAIHFVAWTLAMYPDSNFLYISYSHELAAKQTSTIRSIVTMRDYRNVFGVFLKEESQAKHNFETIRDGSVYAAGAGGTITGRGAGVRGIIDRFSGAIIIDDIHKPDEATSDTIREGIFEWYYNTMISRKNNAKTPIIFIGQRVHESDLAAHLMKEEGFKLVSIPAIDKAGNILHPGLHTREMLADMEARTPYVYAAQYQQDPQPAGGGIFKPDWFYLMDEDPEILATFITADTAETDKTYNDATAFSFWGIYRIKNERAQTDEFALHWLDCREVRVEPKDLEAEFMDFYTLCCRHMVPPMIAAIEKKSTGVTLASTLKKLRGLRIMEIERTRGSGSKIERFLRIQPHVASRLISINSRAFHKDVVVEHMRKITANLSHAHDDIADTVVDAVTLALIDKVIVSRIITSTDNNLQAKSIMSTYTKINELRKSAYKP
jgi:predicted phage terminase large subunit-like protein